MNVCQYHATVSQVVLTLVLKMFNGCQISVIPPLSLNIIHLRNWTTSHYSTIGMTIWLSILLSIISQHHWIRNWVEVIDRKLYLINFVVGDYVVCLPWPGLHVGEYGISLPLASSIYRDTSPCIEYSDKQTFAVLTFHPSLDDGCKVL